ncbi:MAG: aminotransferase class I/II-fold pyridoxal phosphate-dependent enzyme [Myxococcota bacterium]
MSRIYLSPPHMSPDERRLLLDAFDSNWIAPLGPHVTAFEQELAAFVGVGHATALSSGTAALHLALIHVGVRPGEVVLCPSFTFAATANAITYVGASPVFVDSERTTWCVDPDAVEEAIRTERAAGRRVAAVISVDLYGLMPDYRRLERICDAAEVPLIEDAAEALGSRLDDRFAGSFGRMAAFSFNGNKIITTSGGGMLVSDDEEATNHARHLATQARQPVPYYEHKEVGYNYRLSNLLAAVGRGQLSHLEERIAARRINREHYEAGLGSHPLIRFLPVPPGQTPNHWLTCITLEGVEPEVVRLHLEAQGIESRHLWKPMHLQPVFGEARTYGGEVCSGLFAQGLCLPSGSALTDADRDKVVEGVLAAVATA